MSPTTFVLFCATSVAFGVNCLINRINGDDLNDDTLQDIKSLVNRVQVLEAIVQSHPGELETLRRELIGKMEEQQHAHKTEMDKLRDDFEFRLSKMQTETQDKVSSMHQKCLDGLSELRNLCYPQYGLPDSNKQSNGSIKQSNDRHPGRVASITMNDVERNGSNSILEKTKVKGFILHARARRQETRNTVAFFATLSKTMEHMGDNQNIIFDHVLTNIGDAYDPNHGLFRAPVGGVYVFSTTIIVPGYNSTQVCFVLNKSKITTMWLNGAEKRADTNSNTIILHLAQGDDVCVQHYWSHDTNAGIYGYHHSMMSGFLLAADEDLPSVPTGDVSSILAWLHDERTQL